MTQKAKEEKLSIIKKPYQKTKKKPNQPYMKVKNR
jgi:hypothetical protein